MYPNGFAAAVNIGSIGEILCGASRPGHFNGVATVVVKLFNIVMPDSGYFGQKDFQQTVIIKKIVTDLDYNVNIIVCPTVREHDGLAMSSRNTYLDHEERKAAPILYKALKLGEEFILPNGEVDVSYIKEQIRKYIISEPLANIDYIEVVSVTHLEKVVKIDFPVAICVAVKIGKTRLIDNIIVDRK
jgi:pantoate--beta-alanine ligase